jgi:hypothetical protein
MIVRRPRGERLGDRREGMTLPINGSEATDNSHNDGWTEHDPPDDGGRIEWLITREIQRVFGAVAGIGGLDEDPAMGARHHDHCHGAAGWSWRLVGHGYTPGQAVLAANIARDAHVNADAARDADRETRAQEQRGGRQEGRQRGRLGEEAVRTGRPPVGGTTRRGAATADSNLNPWRLCQRDSSV